MHERAMKAWREERGRQWSDGFTVFQQQMIPPEYNELDFLSDAEWNTARELLERGYTLGFVACNEEPVTFLAEITQRMKDLPLRAYCDDDENMLYVAAKDAEARLEGRAAKPAAPIG